MASPRGVTLIIGQDGQSNHTLIERISAPWKLQYTHHGAFGAMRSTSHYVKIFSVYKSCMLVLAVGALTTAHLDYLRRLAQDIPTVHIVAVAGGVTNCLASDCALIDQVYVSKHLLLSFCMVLKIQSCLFPEWPVRRFIDALETLVADEYIQRDPSPTLSPALSCLPAPFTHPQLDCTLLHKRQTAFAAQHGYQCVMDHVADFFKLFNTRVQLTLSPTLMRTIMVKLGKTYALGEYHYDAIRVHMPHMVFTVASDRDAYEWFVRQGVNPEAILFLELLMDE